MSVLISPPSCAEALQAILQRGHLTVAVKDNLRPLGFRDVAGQLQGLEIDIARRLAQELIGREDAVVLKPVQNQERLAAVLDGRVDIAIAQVTATGTRSRVVAFSLPYYGDGTALVTKNPVLKQSLDIQAQTVAVLKGSSTIDTLRYRLPQARLVPVESYQAAHELLEAGGAIAFAADASVLAGWVQEFPDYRLLAPTLSVEPLCIVLPKGLQYDNLRQRINQILLRWQAEDWLEQRADYWGLP
jgi:polar amino acid transport system substrate-binding protein